MAQTSKLLPLSTPVYSEPPEPAVLKTSLLEPEPSAQDAGPRKLVRPHLPEHLVHTAPRRLRGPAPLQAGVATHSKPAAAAASHAEASYFQKQIQAGTTMVFVLEDGEHVEGVVEWFDRDSIKIRGASRMLLFKRSIKYLYKAGAEEHS